LSPLKLEVQNALAMWIRIPKGNEIEIGSAVGNHLFSIREIKIYEKTVANKALRGNSPQNPPHEGSTAGSCVSAIVVNHFLYINKY
jgi:hypothetical protein